MLRKLLGAAVTIVLFSACDVAMDNPLPPDSAAGDVATGTDSSTSPSADTTGGAAADAGSTPAPSVGPGTGGGATPSTGGTTPVADAPAAVPITHTITIMRQSYILGTITISAGDKVQWVFQDGSTVHNVTEQSSPSKFASGDKSTGTFEWIFNTPGSYKYLCTKHPKAMTGAITVQ